MQRLDHRLPPVQDHLGAERILLLLLTPSRLVQEAPLLCVQVREHPARVRGHADLRIFTTDASITRRIWQPFIFIIDSALIARNVQQDGLEQTDVDGDRGGGGGLFRWMPLLLLLLLL